MKGLSTFLPSNRCEGNFCTLFSRKNTSIVIKSAQNVSIVIKKIAKRMESKEVIRHALHWELTTS